MISEERLQKLEEFQKAIGFNFQNISLLDCALTHKSYTNQDGGRVENNERLEFMGDAVIDLVIRDYSLKRFPESSEGELSKLRSAVASKITLAVIARRMELGKFLLLGKGEESSGGRRKRSLLADALEALAAAIYFDGGFYKAYEVILAFIRPHIDKISQGSNQGDYKSRLQEYTQNMLGKVPDYRVIGEEGPEHDKTFEVELSLEGQRLGLGRGKSKKIAEQRAAKEALESLLQKGDNLKGTS